MSPLENCRALQVLLNAFPPEQLDLAAYRNHTSCGTLYCLFGLAVLRGIGGLHFTDDAAYTALNGKRLRHGHNSAEVQAIFGPGADGLFDVYGAGWELAPDFPATYQKGLVYQNGRPLDDYSLAVARLAYHIANLEQLEKNNADAT